MKIVLRILLIIILLMFNLNVVYANDNDWIGYFDIYEYEYVNLGSRINNIENLFDNDTTTYAEFGTIASHVRITFQNIVEVKRVKISIREIPRNGQVEIRIHDVNGSYSYIEIMTQSGIYEFIVPETYQIASGIQILTFANNAKINEIEIYTEELEKTEPPELGVNEGDKELYLYWNKVKGASKYRVYLDGEVYSDTENITYTIRDLENFRTYEVCVSAINYVGLESDKACREATPVNPDEVPPPAPYNLEGKPGHEHVRLTWLHDKTGDFKEYRIYRDNELIATTLLLTYTDTQLENYRTYTYYVTAVDRYGNESEKSNEITVMPFDDRPPPPPDLTDPDKIVNEDLKETVTKMYDVFEVAKRAGLLIVIAAVLLGVIFVVAYWLWKMLRKWFAKSGNINDKRIRRR